VAAAAVLGLAACGGGSSSTTSSTTTTGAQAGRGGFLSAARDPKVTACLKKQGVTLPSGRSRQGNGGRPPTRTTPNGTPPAGGGRRFGNSAQFQKLRTALQKCGVKLPAGPAGGGAPGGAGTGTTTGAT
jgi:hypothetical protein